MPCSFAAKLLYEIDDIARKDGYAIFRPIRYVIWMIQNKGTKEERAEYKAVCELESAISKVRSCRRDVARTWDSSNHRCTNLLYQAAYEEALRNFYNKFSTRICYIPTQKLPRDDDEIRKLAALSDHKRLRFLG